MSDVEELYKNCLFCAEDLAFIHNVRKETLLAWINGRRRPAKRNEEVWAKIVNFMYLYPKLDRDPSWGFATRDQIDKVVSLAPCLLRDNIYQDIIRQNKNGGRLSIHEAKLMGLYRQKKGDY